MRYIGSMKVKTSITLSSEVLNEIEQNLGVNENKSRFIENAVVYYLYQRQKAARNKTELNLINQYAEELNHEAEEVLGFQDEF